MQRRYTARTHARTHARTRMHSTYLGQRFPVSARFTAAVNTVGTERTLEIPQPCVVWHAAWSIPPTPTPTPTPKRPSPRHGTRVVLTSEEQRGRKNDKKRRSASAVSLQMVLAGRHANHLEALCNRNPPFLCLDGTLLVFC